MLGVIRLLQLLLLSIDLVLKIKHYTKKKIIFLNSLFSRADFFITVMLLQAGSNNS